MKQAENRSARQVTLHLTLPILVTLTLLTAAFSTGSPVFLMPALLIALLCLSGIYGVFRASATLEVSSRASTERVQRGEDVTLNVRSSGAGGFRSPRCGWNSPASAARTALPAVRR